MAKRAEVYPEILQDLPLAINLKERKREEKWEKEGERRKER